MRVYRNIFCLLEIFCIINDKYYFIAHLPCDVTYPGSAMSPSFTLIDEILPARTALYFFSSVPVPDESLYKNNIWPCDTKTPCFTFHLTTFKGFSDGTKIGIVLSAILNGYGELFVEWRCAIGRYRVVLAVNIYRPMKLQDDQNQYVKEHCYRK